MEIGPVEYVKILFPYGVGVEYPRWRFSLFIPRLMAGIALSQLRCSRRSISVAIWVICSLGCSIAEEMNRDLPATELVRNAIGMELVRIPAGEFLMGSFESEAAIKAAFPEDSHEPAFFSR